MTSIKNTHLDPEMYAGGRVPTDVPWKHWEHAIRLHQILRGVAARKGTISYSDATDAISTPGNTLYHRQLDGRVLNLVEYLCLRDGEPPLWILVVSKATGMPALEDDPDGGHSWRPRGGHDHFAVSKAQRECWAWGAAQ